MPKFLKYSSKLFLTLSIISFILFLCWLYYMFYMEVIIEFFVPEESIFYFFEVFVSFILNIFINLILGFVLAISSIAFFVKYKVYKYGYFWKKKSL